MEENKLKGTLGAFLFAAAGGITYLILLDAGFISPFSGLVGAAAAFFGYRLFAGKQSKYGIVISIVATFFMITFAYYIGTAASNLDYYRHAENPGFPNTFGFWFKYSWVFMLDREAFFYYLKDILLLYAFAALACFFFARWTAAALKERE